MIERYYAPIDILDNDTEYIYERVHNIMHDILDYAIAKHCARYKIKTIKELEKHFGIRTSAKHCSDYTNMLNGKFASLQIGMPCFSIHYDLLWKYDEPGDYDREELVALICYLALCSIMGKKYDKVIRTTKDMIFARMNGWSSPNVNKKNKRNRYEMYNTRRMFAKIQDIIEEVFDIEFEKGHHRGVMFKKSGKAKKGNKGNADECTP